MISCREMTELITSYLEGRLSFGQRVAFQLHLGMCRHCRAYLQQMRLTVRLTGQVSAAPMPADVEAELLRRFRNWQTQPAADPGAGQAIDLTGEDPPPTTS